MREDGLSGEDGSSIRGGLRIAGGRIISYRDVCILAGTVFLAHAALLLSLRSVPEKLAVANELLIVVENLLATVALAYAVKSVKSISGRMFVAVGLIAVSQFIYLLADTAVLWIEIVLQGDSFPSIADALYLLTYPVFLVGVVLLPARPTSMSERLKVFLDMGMVMISAVLIFWNILLAPIIEGGAENSLAMTVSLAYPVADLVLLYAVISLLFRSAENAVPATLLALRGAATVIGDFFFTYQTLQGTYENGSLVSLGWVAGYLFSILAGVYVASHARDIARTEPGGGLLPIKRRWPVFIPYAWLLVAYMLLLWSYSHRMPMDGRTIALAVGAITGLVVLRQIITFSENFKLSDKLQEDLARRERDAQALSESEARFRTLSETSPASIFIHQGDRFVYVNPAMEKLTGYPESLLLKMHFSELILPEYRDIINEREIARLRGESVPLRYEIRFVTGTGEVGWADLTMEVVLYDGKKSLMGTAFDITDQKKMEARLLETNETLRSIFAAAPVSIEVVDRDGVIRMWNDASEEIFGWSATEIVGQRIPYILPEDIELFKDIFGSVFRGEVLNQFEAPTVRKDGTIRTIQVSAAPIRDEVGHTTSAVGILSDVTDQRRAEKERSRQDRIMAAMAASASSLLLAQDLDQAINDGLKSLALATEADRGYIFENEESESKEHLTNQRYEWARETVSSELENPALQRLSYERYFPGWYDRLSSGDPVMVMVSDLSESGRVLLEEQGILSLLIVPIMSMERFWGFIGFDDCKTRRIWKESDVAILQTAAASIGSAIIRQRAILELARARDELEVRVSERTADLVLANRDLSREIEERKAAEDLLSLDEQRLEALLKLSQMRETTDKTATNFALEEAVRLTESTIGFLAFLAEDESSIGMHAWSKEVVGQCAIPDKPFSFSIDRIGLLDDAVRRREPTIINDYDMEAPFKKGSSRTRLPEGHIPIKRYMSVPVFDGSKIVALAGVGNKDRDYDESDVRQLTLLMDGMWWFIKQKREEERRLEIISELETKNAEMERFVYTVSHDLRSPLVTVQGFMEFLKEDMETGDHARFEKDMRMVTEAVARMDRLLDETLELSRIGRVTGTPEDVPFGDLLADALLQVDEAIRSRGVKVIVAVDFPAVRVDSARILEVLVNLLDNSVKCMGDQPHPRLEIGHTHSGTEEIFFVKDNGIGIDPSQHEKIFELFYKIERQTPGTGAGMAIVKRIIEVHGGRIWIESALGEGCTVFFTLPLSTSEK